MATTTNFGWTTPDDTALVKDGASAIRTLGSSIDTSMAQLKGGTTGQILSKTSNTDMAFTWINNDQGDITAVTTAANSGLAGGATSGAVALTLNTAAKGDLIVGTGAGTASGLTVGANNTVLTADSTTATGLKWATAPVPAFVGVKVYQSASQNLSNATSTVITFNSEDFDTNNFHSTVTNTSRLTVPVGYAGKYLVYCCLGYNGNATGQRQAELLVNGNGNIAKFIGLNSGASYIAQVRGATTLTLAEGDYVELYGYQDSGGTLGNDAGVSRTFLGMNYLGA